MDENRSSECNPPVVEPTEPRTRGLVTIAVCCIVALCSAGVGTRRPLEATTQMERLAVKVSKAKFIHPATAAQIEELMTLPPYDCAQVACVSELQHRNSIVRSRLDALIAGKTRS